MSKLKNIREMLQKILIQFNSIVTDKGTLYYDEDEIAVGVSVTAKDEEGNDIQVEDGDYYLGDEDGRTLVIKNGVIDEIIEKEDEQPDPEQINSKPELIDSKQVNGMFKQIRFNKIKEAFEESYAEKEMKIIEAIMSVENFECYLIEAGDDYAVVESYIYEDDEYYNRYYRYSISWNEEGEAIVGERWEVKPAFVPVEEDVEKISEEVEELQNTIKQLNNKIEELQKEPSGKPAKEEFKKNMKTGNSQFDNLMRYC